MRVFPLFPSVVTAVLLAGCAAPMPRGNGAAATSAPAGSASGRAAALRDLAGEYDNHAQRGDGAPPASGFAPPPLHQWLRPTHAADALLWRLQQSSGTAASEGRWLLREEGAALVPYRPLNAAANAAFDDKGASYRFQAADWAPLGACALQRRGSGFDYRVDAAACSALLPGLGAAAALLPQRLSLVGDTLTLATVSDSARGADAVTVSHRVRWFAGWDALNGAGPRATPENSDWHLRRDLRLHSEGGRIPLRWRDGSESGYSLELARLNYRESNTEVLRLAVIEDASGRTLSYAWANPEATRIGLNLGWLQVGLDQDSGQASGGP